MKTPLLSQKKQIQRIANYRTLALNHYPAKCRWFAVPRCVQCGFAIEAVLQVAHLDGNRKNSSLKNLAILCPTCHRMYDLGLIPRSVIKTMRGCIKAPNTKKVMKQAGIKAVLTRTINKLLQARSLKKGGGEKAHVTRRLMLAQEKLLQIVKSEL